MARTTRRVNGRPPPTGGPWQPHGSRRGTGRRRATWRAAKPVAPNAGACRPAAAAGRAVVGGGGGGAGKHAAATPPSGALVDLSCT